MKLIHLCFLFGFCLLGCQKPTSGIVQDKFFDNEKKIITKWSSGPNSEGIVPEAYWLKLDTGTVRVSSNEWYSVQVGDRLD